MTSHCLKIESYKYISKTSKITLNVWRDLCDVAIWRCYDVIYDRNVSRPYKGCIITLAHVRGFFTGGGGAFRLACKNGGEGLPLTNISICTSISFDFLNKNIYKTLHILWQPVIYSIKLYCFITCMRLNALLFRVSSMDVIICQIC